MTLPPTPSQDLLGSLPTSTLGPPSPDHAPPALAAHLLEVLTPLYDLLERACVQSQPGDADGDADGTNGAGAEAPAASLGPPLAIKDFAGEVLRVKHAAAAARAQIRGLPDLGRSVPEQLAEHRLLLAQKDRAVRMRDQLAEKAREVRARPGGQAGETAEGRSGDVEMGEGDGDKA